MRIGSGTDFSLSANSKRHTTDRLKICPTPGRARFPGLRRRATARPLGRKYVSSEDQSMKKRHLISLGLLLLLGLATPRGVAAQVLYGSLTGNVTDQSGAVVTGAKVEALNIGTGVSTSVVTDERGAYLFSSLQAGLYKVTITSANFKALAQDNVRIEVNTV